MVRLRQLHEKYGGRAQFLFVYIHEASHELPEALRDFAEPAGAPLSSRRHLLQRIEAGRKHFDLRFPCLLDNEQEEIQQLYRAYPMRLLLVNTAGRVVSDSGRMEFDDSFPWKKITDWFDCRD